jgi:hypothetical protein
VKPTRNIFSAEPMNDDEKKLLAEERRKRLALQDRIARALGVLDPDPDPEKLDVRLSYCRICRLLLERYRAASALVELDPTLIEDGGTHDVVLALRTDVEKHVRTTGHEPILEAITALAAAMSPKGS